MLPRVHLPMGAEQVDVYLPQRTCKCNANEREFSILLWNILETYYIRIRSLESLTMLTDFFGTS